MYRLEVVRGCRAWHRDPSVRLHDLQPKNLRYKVAELVGPLQRVPFKGHI